MSGKLKQIRDRVKSLKSTNKITKAMEMIASVSLKSERKKLIATNEYFKEISTIAKSFNTQDSELSNIKDVNVFKGHDASNNVLLIVISPNKGLCGNVNNALEKEVKKYISNCKKKITLFTIGKKIDEFARKHLQEYEIISSKSNDYENLVEIISSREFANIDFLYTHFTSIMENKPTVLKAFPVTIDENSSIDKFKIEQDLNLMIDSISSLLIKGCLQYCKINSTTSEMASRMIAMDGATKNSKKIIDKLTLQCNKIRQAKITNELIDVVSGAQVISG
ncbi:F0F1 ATP synthase subunit gamma [Candidatus Deianiraea vastatrix]|uniref:ATP synthase gamma chain n=1 Tax=Candidatus Deianiraea vastatrix TaxID=2163644 RepID=A0A5B8XCC9_9RICK|nr:FoF1 ATP synthase subunit gamma [Candidatus Deianiraea vastatrix]QED22920.1 ATP synthase gamma chain [Candidatus Deianiraea vastatrix]